jgi:HK97 family phage portal protein
MLADLFRPQEARSISFQDVWGAGEPWAPDGSYGPLDAIKLSAVIACIDLRAKTIGQLPLNAYRAGAGGVPELVPTQPQLIAAPSRLPRSQWLRQMSVSRDLYGNAFGAIIGRDAAGWPTAVEWLDPASVVVRERSTLGRPEVTYNGAAFPYSDLLVVPGFPMPGSAFGISPLERSGLVELSHRAQEFGRDWFRNGAVPSTVISADVELDAATATRIRDAAVAAWRKRRPAVLGSGLKVEHVKVNAEESQFLGTMRQVQADICQVFGVPPEKIGVASSGSSVTYANREQQVQQFLVDGINADLVLIQEVLGAAIPAGQFVRINTGALLRSDLTARYASYQVALDAGFLTLDEVRELEERPPIPATADSISARDLAELLQKVYLAVDVVVTADEARDLARSAGANLVGSLPAPPATPAPTQETPHE